jgi:hypothetical protein
MIERRQFLAGLGLATTAGIAAASCNKPAPEQKAAVASGAKPAARESQAESKVSLFRTSSMNDFPVSRGSSKGLFLTFEGLCAIVLPPQAGQTIRIGLLTGHKHLATMKLHRDGVAPNATWEPTTADDDYYSYALKGLNIKITAKNADKIARNYTDINDDCPKEETWTNLGWALDVRKDLQQTGALHDNWWKNKDYVDTVFELDLGWLEYKFDGNEPIEFDLEPYMWTMPDQTKRALKQLVRYRLSADDIVIETRPLADPDGQVQATLPIENNLLAYAGVKHFPLGHKRPRLAKDEKLKEAEAYYGLLAGFSGEKKVPIALPESDDCDTQATPDCSCCPPAIY